MNIHHVAKDLNRKYREVKRVCNRFGFGKDNIVNDEDISFLQEFFCVTKEKLMKEVQTAIELHPFITEDELSRLTGRRSSYISWIVRELTIATPTLAEDDDDKLFYVTDQMIQEEELDCRNSRPKKIR